MHLYELWFFVYMYPFFQKGGTKEVHVVVMTNLLKQASPNRRRQLSPTGSTGGTSGQQLTEEDLQSAQLTVAQLGYHQSRVIWCQSHVLTAAQVVADCSLSLM